MPTKDQGTTDDRASPFYIAAQQWQLEIVRFLGSAWQEQSVWRKNGGEGCFFAYFDQAFRPWREWMALSTSRMQNYDATNHRFTMSILQFSPSRQKDQMISSPTIEAGSSTQPQRCLGQALRTKLLRNSFVWKSCCCCCCCCCCQGVASPGIRVRKVLQIFHESKLLWRSLLYCLI